MGLQSSGPISIGDIAAEFGGAAPHSLSEYYGVDDGIPTSGIISISDFYGASADIGLRLTIGTDGVDDWGWRTGEYGSISPDPFYINSQTLRGVWHNDWKGVGSLSVDIFTYLPQNHFVSITTPEGTYYTNSVQVNGYNQWTSPNRTQWTWNIPAPVAWETQVGQTIDVSFVE